MPRSTTQLTAKEVQNLKPPQKQTKHFDGGGLYLLIKSTGQKYWRLKYQYNGKEKNLALGVYPDISLKEAREKRQQAKALLKQGIDPQAERKDTKHQQETQHLDCFEAQAREWYEAQKSAWKSAKHTKQVITSLEKDIFPSFGHLPIGQITRSQVLKTIQAIEDRGAGELASRTLQRVNAVFDYAMIKGLIENNPATNLSKVLKKRVKGEYTFLSIDQMPAFIEKLNHYEGEPKTKLATQLLMHTFLRTGELRHGQWQEIDFDNALWTIPANRMKINRDHLVPLSTQVLDLLSQLQELSGHCKLMFPSRSSVHKPISDNTINGAIKRLGFSFTGHGFRKTASTTLNELGYNDDAIERQLSHVARNQIRGVYNKAQYLEQRRQLMQDWSDIIDQIKPNGIKN